jgi:hypothetical protein
MLRSPLILALISLALVACENSVHIKGTVDVPPAAQARLASGEKGMVVVKPRIPKSSLPALVVGVICQPSNETVAFPFDFGDKPGCANQGEVSAWLERIPAEASPQPACGPSARVSFDAEDPTRRLATGTASVFAGNDSGCHSDAAEVKLTLTP